MRRNSWMLLCLVAACVDREPRRQRTYINPIDIDDRYNYEQVNQGMSDRSGADPARSP